MRSHQPLRGTLNFVAGLLALGGVILAATPGRLPAALSACTQYLSSGWGFQAHLGGGLNAILIAYVIYLVARDPLRYASLIIVASISLFVSALVEIVTEVKYGDAYFLHNTVWVLSVLKIMFGVWLLALRPRESPSLNAAIPQPDQRVT